MAHFLFTSSLLVFGVGMECIQTLTLVAILVVAAAAVAAITAAAVAWNGIYPLIPILLWLSLLLSLLLLLLLPPPPLLLRLVCVVIVVTLGLPTHALVG